MQNRQEEDAFELLAALEDETPEELRAQRNHERRTVRSHAWISAVHHGSAKDDGVQAAIGDVSATGCRLLTEVPLAVGQVFRLEFEGDDLEERSAFGRVVRCQLVADESFDIGIQFYGPAELDWDCTSLQQAVGL